MAKQKLTIGIVGGGNMGSAIVGGVYKQFRTLVCEADRTRAGKLQRQYQVTIKNLEDTVSQSTIVVLAVKPQDFDSVLLSLKPYVTLKHLVISIAAGITTAYIEKRLGKDIRVIRSMPNLPVVVGEGMTGLARGKKATAGDMRVAEGIFGLIGQTATVDEKYIDAITAVSGSGPAYVFYFIECLQKAAQKLGLEPVLARELVIQTLFGSLKLIDTGKEEAAVLRQRVTSKGGTTQAALDVMFKKQYEKIVLDALSAAKKRAKELSK